MTDLIEYSTKFQTIRLERDERGVLEVTFHSQGGALQWYTLAHTEMSQAFRLIAKDRHNRVVLMTGTGAELAGPRVRDRPRFDTPPNADQWEEIAYSEALELIGGLLDIAVPVIAVVNGPAFRHGEVPLLGDIVIASEDASFEDTAHFKDGGIVPGDGVHVVYTMLLGINRARHFLLTGCVIDAKEALRLGLVAEVLPKDRVVDRGRALAQELSAKLDRLLRYTRSLLVQPIKRNMLDYLALGLGVEGLAILR